MGAYTWLSEDEFKRFSTVNTDKDINEALQKVRSVMPEWYIDERIHRVKLFWRTRVDIRYTVYHRQQEAGNTEVRIQISCSTKNDVLNLLYGLYMGYKRAEQLIKQ